jgi:hypothetical protein
MTFQSSGPKEPLAWRLLEGLLINILVVIAVVVGGIMWIVEVIRSLWKK